jgi:transposase
MRGENKMKRPATYTVEEKINIIQMALAGDQTKKHISAVHHIDPTTLYDWIQRYQAQGASGLKRPTSFQRYSEETKLRAVHAYLNHAGSLRTICRAYHISRVSVLQSWIAKYTGDESPSMEKGTSLMRNGRKTTLTERIEIVQYTLANAHNYQAAAQKYDVSYQQIYSWIKKYEAQGEAGLEDRRGKGPADQPALTETEQLKLKVKQLEHRNEYLEAEAGLLKKLKEIERRDPFS